MNGYGIYTSRLTEIFSSLSDSMEDIIQQRDSEDGTRRLTPVQP